MYYHPVSSFSPINIHHNYDLFFLINEGNLKLNESLYRTSAGCNLSARGAAQNQTAVNFSHPGTLAAANGLLSGDWCAMATNNIGSSPRVGASGTNFRLPISHICKR
ncbi:unnamed protein product [Heterobilharzia americana]|nr:unnamed protein product [Heterobilharzia americana]